MAAPQFPTTSPDPVVAEQEVRQSFDAWAESFRSRDIDAMMSYYTRPEVNAFDLMPPIQFDGEEMWHQNWVDFFSGFAEDPRLEFDDVRIRVSGAEEADIAVLRCFSHLVGRMGDVELDAWTRQTNCYTRTADGRWLMFHDHVSFPTDFATGRSLMDLTPEG